MLRALTLSPAESFSPTLLRTEPAYLASWIRFRFVRWLLNAPLVVTEWKYPNAHALEVGGDKKSTIELWNGDQKVDLEYAFPGAGFEIGLPIPTGIAQTLPSMKGSTNLWVVQGEATGDGDQTKLEELGVTKTCMAVDLRMLVDAQIVRRGLDVPRAMLLFGVAPELRADLGKLAMYTRRLDALASSQLSRQARYTPGITRTEFNPIDRRTSIDMRAIREDVDLVFSHYPFRSVLFVNGMQGGYSGHDISTYVGEIVNAGTDEKGAVPKVGGKLKELAKFGLDQLGKDPKEIKKDLVDRASSEVKTVFNDAGERMGIPSTVSDFAFDHAYEIATKDWSGIAKDALTQGLGGGPLAEQAANIALEKITGQPVTTAAIKQLGAQGLKALVDKWPVVASGPSGDTAVTGVTTDSDGAATVQTHDGKDAGEMSHDDFSRQYDTVSSPGID